MSFVGVVCSPAAPVDICEVEMWKTGATEYSTY